MGKQLRETSLVLPLMLSYNGGPMSRMKGKYLPNVSMHGLQPKVQLASERSKHILREHGMYKDRASRLISSREHT